MHSVGHRAALSVAGDAKTQSFANFSHALVGAAPGKASESHSGYKKNVVDYSKQVHIPPLTCSALLDV